MIGRLFIANRGEIALRIMRTAKRLGIKTILGVSDADAASQPALMADETVRVGPAPSAQSYLSIPAVIAAAKAARADAIHPGYGFLSEKAEFARAVEEAGIIFVGPDLSSLDAMGDKLMARRVATDAGLPVVPGGTAGSREEAISRAAQCGYPVLLKAVAGGGGKGMKQVSAADGLLPALDMAMAEAEAAFGDRRIYIERYIPKGRHVEVQVLGDGKSVIHLGTRDCSIQRRFQKLVEEAPAPGLPDNARAAIEAAAVHVAQHLGYRGAGTVEFLVDAESFEFYFLEMNARLQVEHPVTEAITGIDLVEQQLLIADGLPLSITQGMVTFTGHAIEVRINAEDWRQDFQPCPGAVHRAAWPVGTNIRVDTHIATGSTVPAYYDSLMGKIIVSGATRADACAILSAALRALRIEGVASTAALHQIIAGDDRFKRGAVDTGFFAGLAA